MVGVSSCCPLSGLVWTSVLVTAGQQPEFLSSVVAPASSLNRLPAPPVIALRWLLPSVFSVVHRCTSWLTDQSDPGKGLCTPQRQCCCQLVTVCWCTNDVDDRESMQMRRNLKMYVFNADDVNSSHLGIDLLILQPSWLPEVLINPFSFV